jgi:transcriptional regulator with XRE-family HTH domain
MLVRVMTLHDRLKELRLRIELSQEALGAQGFISTPGWIKIENGTRKPSDEFLETFVNWLVEQRYITPSIRDGLLDELLTLRYLRHKSAFIRQLAQEHRFHRMQEPATLKVAEDPLPPRDKKKKNG